MNSEIKFYKWQTSDYKKLYSSIRGILDMNNLQFYMPFYSLYFYIHNKPKANHKIDMKRNYYLKEVLEITKSRYYNSNMFLKGNVYNESKNSTTECELFCKSIPILDPIHVVNNNYNLVNHNNYHLPSNYNYNTFHKINDMNNTAYIDVLCSFLFSNLTYYKKNPSFPLYYGSVNGIGDYNYDLTEDYDDIKNDRCFNENIDKGFKLEIYVSDDESDNEGGESDIESSDGSVSHNSSVENIYNDELTESEKERLKLDKDDINMMSDYIDKCSDESSNEKREDSSFDDCIAKLLKIPIQLLFIEKLEGTLEDLLDKDIKEEVLLSCIFQVSFALTYLQKHYQFTHNDLHINNVMFKKTESKYLYYKYNNLYFRVPTYGYIFKIIDFGRAIYTNDKMLFCSNSYDKGEDAYTQYNTEPFYNPEKKKVEPNMSFDLCRLGCSMFDFLIDDIDDLDEQVNNDPVIKLIVEWCKDDKGKNILYKSSGEERYPDFKLYKMIARTVHNHTPETQLKREVFSQYVVDNEEIDGLGEKCIVVNIDQIIEKMQN